MKRTIALLLLLLMFLLPAYAMAAETVTLTAPDGRAYTVSMEEEIVFDDFDTPLGFDEGPSAVTITLIAVLAVLTAGYGVVLFRQERSIRRLQNLLPHQA